MSAIKKPSRRASSSTKTTAKGRTLTLRLSPEIAAELDSVARGMGEATASKTIERLILSWRSALADLEETRSQRCQLENDLADNRQLILGLRDTMKLLLDRTGQERLPL